MSLLLPHKITGSEIIPFRLRLVLHPNMNPNLTVRLIPNGIFPGKPPFPAISSGCKLFKSVVILSKDEGPGRIEAIQADARAGIGALVLGIFTRHSWCSPIAAGRGRGRSRGRNITCLARKTTRGGR